MKKIKLTQGQFALIDDADFESLNQHKWYADKDHSGNFYAVRKSSWKNGKRHMILMSRQILGLERGDPRQADHRNHNTLNNRQSNLRICTNRQNQMNRKLAQNKTSRFKGVSWYKRVGKWRAYIEINRKEKHLGYFMVEEFAALAYNNAAKKHYGEFACPNQI